MPNPATIGSTGDYADIDAWVAVEDALTTGVVEGRMQAQAHTAEGTLTGLAGTPGASHYWLVTALAADRHSGKRDTAKAHFDLSDAATQAVILCSDVNSVVEYLQFTEFAVQWGNEYGVRMDVADCECRRCIFWNVGPSSGYGASPIYMAAVNGEVHNCLMHDTDRWTFYLYGWGGTWKLYNNTVENFGQDSNNNCVETTGTGTLDCKNNIFLNTPGTGRCIDLGTGTVTTTACSDTDGEPSTLDSETDATIKWVDKAGKDYNITDETSAAHDSATDNLGSKYQNDIKDVDRGTANWDLGCFSIVAAGAATRRRVRMGRRR